MTQIRDWLAKATKQLSDAGIDSARLDVLILLEDALGMDRAAILAHPETELTPPQLGKLNKQVTQRLKHLPLAYIRGRSPFFGREFMVNEHVLVPRPESETMVEILVKLPLPAQPVIADIGTGTGCLGITAALELPDSTVSLYDIDEQALKVAAQNARTLKADVSIRKNDLLDGLSKIDVILANLPYVPERYSINQAAGHEPKHAIFSGKDGLNLYRRFWEQIKVTPNKPKFVLTESLPPQHNDLAQLAKDAGYELTDSQDFVQLFQPA